MKKYYYYDKKNMKMEKVQVIPYILLIFLSILLLSSNKSENISKKKINYTSKKTKILSLEQKNKFNELELKEYIIGLNIKFPHIVFAQAKLESGYFKSTIFRENNNLFGMRLAKQRPRTALGVKGNYAYYINWKESVIDYALYSAAYLKNIKTESEYFEYLKSNYATDPNYINKLKKIIKNNK